tara:strand:+ start:500 stop:775 length:276 start_codon:yes stop_codon:yes gene_type:complete
MVTFALLAIVLPEISFAFELAQSNRTPAEKELFNTLPGENQKGGILDATNPMELMDRLRRATSMDNATSASDAIDEALKAFENKGIDLTSD